MPLKDKAADREYHRDLMRRRRANQQHDEPPIMPAAAPQSFTAQHATPAADPGTAGPQDRKKCIWSDKDICILFLSQNFKPIRCYGLNRLCEGKPGDINIIPFKQCRENNDKAQQFTL